MGCYVNPKGRSKESWLSERGLVVGSICSTEPDKVPEWIEFDSDNLPVVLVDNGPFTAAGVCYSEKEYEIFTDAVRDDRIRIIYEVPIKDLSEVSDIEKYPIKK